MESPESELKRRVLCMMLNDLREDRPELAKRWGQVWDTQEVQRDFEIRAFAAPFVQVVRKSDGKRGAMLFQHLPRFYFEFIPDDAPVTSPEV